MSGETVLLEHLWGRGPFVCPVRGRREHKEQIEASTRAVYPGSGRDGHVKPYSCLVVLNWGARELEELAAPSVWAIWIPKCPNPFYVAHGPPFIGKGVTDRCQRKRKG